jgi:SagB-type dehydrogenase family enzyme
VPSEPAARALVRRRSSRNFVNRDVPQDAFRHLLALIGGCFTGGLSMGPAALPGIATGFLAGSVEGVAPGFYLWDPPGGRYARVASGQLTAPMAAVCLDQAWLKNAGIHFLFMLNPGELDATGGPRGYRYAMLQAGFLGQMVYLGATALGLGACGIGAIYDQEAGDLLGLEEGAVLGYLVATGVVKRTK